MNILQQFAYGTKGYEIIFQKPQNKNKDTIPFDEIDPNFESVEDFNDFDHDFNSDFEPVEPEFNDDFNDFSSDFEPVDDFNDDFNDFEPVEHDFNETVESVSQPSNVEIKPLPNFKPKKAPDVTIKRAIKVEIPTDLHTLLNYNYDETAEHWLKEHGF
jgi:hypothetical protein